MSQQQMDAFHAHLQSNPERFSKLLQDADSVTAFVDRALIEAEAEGYQFSRAEALAWMEKYMQAANDELSDTQLEAVAGGKSKDSNDPQGRRPAVRMRP